MRPSPSWAEAAQRRARRLGVDLTALGGRLWPIVVDPVRVGVSGGADSLGLAALLALGGKRVLAIHVDHGLRPGSAEEGADVARQLWPLGIPVLERRVRVAPGPNLEARARSARLAALGDAARAHTMDDQAETVLLNLLRGSGLVGIGAMEPGPLHPALALRRSELARVCEAVGLVPLEDPMNRDGRFRRVRVRRELLPLAAAIAERDVVPLLARAAEHAREAVRLQALHPELAPPTTQLASWVRRSTGLRLSAAHRRALVQVVEGTRRAHALPSDVDVRRVGTSLVLSSRGREIARLGLESEGRRP